MTSISQNINSHPLTPESISTLQANGCFADNWNNVCIHNESDLSLFRNVRFRGTVSIGRTVMSPTRDTGFFNCCIESSTIGDDCFIFNIGAKISGATIGNCVTIENVGRIEFETEAPCGAGTAVSVLDETGSRPVYIYPGISSQIASLMAHHPVWTEEKLLPLIQEKSEASPISTSIGNDAVIKDALIIKNTFVDTKVTIEGARRLINGAVINHASTSRDSAYIGSGVDAENFILEDGRLDSGTIVRNCYIGQGATLEKGFTAHDSLFFANSTCENGEACAVIAGPYTVTMHKSSLLIGAQYSFMNAGSGTNSSNHMYKLGPVHWGVMQRGVKTSSNSYIMWGGRIGAFSLLMGAHKSHPDTSEFPFSYLFSDDKGQTIVTPGIMLKSCGLMRDEKKWPARDARIKKRIPLNDRITFEVLSPYTVGRMLHTLPLIKSMRNTPLQEKYHLYKGMKFTDASLERAEHLYTIAILKYFHDKIGNPTELPASHHKPEEWVDLGGQIMPASCMRQAMDAESIEEIENIFDNAFKNYASLEREWILDSMTPEWRQLLIDKGATASETLSELAETDRRTYLEALTDYNSRMEPKQNGNS